MNCGEDDSSPYITSYRNGPYSSPLASTASSSSASVWSDAASQTSDDSSVSSVTSDSETSESYCCTTQREPSFTSTNVCEQLPATAKYWPIRKAPVEVPTEQRQHPRRTSVGTTRCPPTLVRQSERKGTFVDSLVDSSTQIVEAIWPLSSVRCRSEMGNKGVLPLRTFIQETLRRSRTSYSTLQVALYYLILIKPHVPKHDFTMEQPDDVHANRALQCGRRMFLAALILASKYLQDRNYSARAWSKISGLNTIEINQNETAFLLAVNWRLHITDAVFTRWTEIVLKYTPSQPPSPSAVCPSLSRQSAEWKSIILRLNPELDNVESIPLLTPAKPDVTSFGVTMPYLERTSNLGYGSGESTPTPRYYTPDILEPAPNTVYPQSKPAPALGLLPTPRLTPQSVGFNTPAVSAANYMLCKSSMSFAMSQASNVSSAQSTEKWLPCQTSSPQPFVFPRRSSLAISVSTASSPESMVSDTSSRSSRSSSISSASSLMSAPVSSKLDVQARCRYAKQCSERLNRVTIATVPEDLCDTGATSSPDSYAGHVSNDLFLDLTLNTPVTRRGVGADCFSSQSEQDAARALQDLHNHPRCGESPNRAGAKRSRPQSIDNSLQENVREMLGGPYRASNQMEWSEDFVRPKLGRSMTSSPGSQVAVRSLSGGKRVCCATEATLSQPIHPSFGGVGGPGMWRDLI
ncbi:hypothetical protein BP5796_01850 [Coleophoma crateriformis]|uniref:Uncharacterized protein n=1 Tax=Coleophoma crateriformis TaxID=565419 RepID=A0A3D8T1M1_9HELO|nr:hypothetical protein BP5796_01850 [Coleophoma crateriformis]